MSNSVFAIAVSLLPACAGLAHAQSTFILSPQGCAMAHCQMNLSGGANAAAPMRRRQ
jgi:hypothetical protein